MDCPFSDLLSARLYCSTHAVLITADIKRIVSLCTLFCPVCACCSGSESCPALQHTVLSDVGQSHARYRRNTQMFRHFTRCFFALILPLRLFLPNSLGRPEQLVTCALGLEHTCHSAEALLNLASNVIRLLCWCTLLSSLLEWEEMSSAGRRWSVL